MRFVFTTLLFFVSSHVLATMPDNSKKLEMDCVKSLSQAIAQTWYWRISSLDKERGEILNQLFFRSHLNQKLTYKDQKMIEKYFRVWIRKGHVSKALYKIYPHYLNKFPEQKSDLNLIESWGKLYKHCHDSPAKKVWSVKLENKELLADQLDRNLTWFNFYEKKLVRELESFLNAHFRGLGEIDGPKARRYAALLGSHVQGVYSATQNSFLEQRRFNAATLFAARVSYATLIKPAPVDLDDLKIYLSGEVFCKALGKGYNKNTALLTAALTYKLARVENRFCDGRDELSHYCRDTLLTSLSQVTRVTRNFNYDYISLVFSTDRLIEDLIGLEKRRLSKEDLSKTLLGDKALGLISKPCL